MTERAVLAVLDNEREYAEKLAEYINQKKPFEIRALTFTKEEELKIYLKQNKITVLLCEEELLKGIDRYADFITILFSHKREEEGQDSIFKYQSADAVAEKIRKTVYGEGADNAGRQRSINAICAVSMDYRFYRLCRELAAKMSVSGKTVLIDLFPFGGREKEGATGSTISELLYYLKSKNVESRQPMAAGADEGFDVISGVDYWGDIRELTNDNLTVLYEYFAEELSYENILIAVDLLVPAADALLELCEGIYYPEPKTDFEQSSFEELKKQMAFSGQSGLIDKIKLYRGEEA